MQGLDTPTPQIDGVAAKADTITTPTHLLGWVPILWSKVLFGGEVPVVGSVRRRDLALLLIVPGLLLYPCLSFHLFEPDEGRYAQIPREMLERGEWIVPTLQGEAYLDKPPLCYWLVMLSYSLFGYHDWAARLVPALAVHAGIFASYLLGRRIVRERAAFWGAMLLSVSPMYLGVGRILTLDGVLTFWVMLGSLAMLLALRSASRLNGWWIVAAIACGLGVMTKGPVALVLQIPPLVAHRWLSGDATRISWRAWLGFFAIVLAINLPWYAAVCIARPEFVRYFLWQHNVQRFVEPFDHVRPVWFYLPILLYGLLPTVLLAWPLGRFLTSTHAEESKHRPAAMGYLLLCGAWCVFFFSMAGCKLPTYILPAFPPLCLALGCFVAGTTWHKSRVLLGMILCAWLFQAGANYVVIPTYARHRSPMGDFEAMQQRCGDPSVPVVCFPRHVDSVAFHVGRSDFKSFRSKDVDLAVQELAKHPRTVVLFGHRNSPESLARYLPSHLRMIDRRPMGVCESAVIVNERYGEREALSRR